MMLLAFTITPFFSRKMSHGKRVAAFTSSAAGRAWMP